ncbi:hypothetical protein [Aeoliella sp.]|uniref:hypothetical protein n=1 Tax=Aeoliella sp. TaxID=2795800 RepID=UPI003CCB76D1
MPSSKESAGIILALAAMVGCQGFAPPATPVAIDAPPVYVEQTGPVFAPPGVIASPTPGGVPTFPDPLAATPAFVPPGVEDTSGALAPQVGLPIAETETPALPNPLKVPVSNHDFAWDQIVDVVSDYFPIGFEQRVHIDQQVWTEGRVETPYQVGATMFEPYRLDSVGAFNRWQSTLQTIRRRAVIRVVPEPDGYVIDIRVDRELEDLPKPEEATAGAATLRNDSSLPSGARSEVSRTEWSPLWIPLGRDVALEQKMLAEMRDRLALTPSVPMTISPVQ